MENQQILMKQKLGFIGILQQSHKIFSEHPKFIALAFLVSLPFFVSVFAHETALQQALIEALRILTKEETESRTVLSNGVMSISARKTGLDRLQEMAQEVSPKFFICALLYLGSVHVLDVLNAIVASGSSSELYARDGSLSLKEMLVGTIKRVGFHGPFTTSIYILGLFALTSTGLVTLATHLFLVSNSCFSVDLLCVLVLSFLGALFLALLTKLVEWSATWNMGLMVSILEEKHGYVAIGVSAYISRGNRRQGFLLMLVFFLWRAVLRLSCLYMCWYNKGCAMAVLVTTGLGCFVNTIKWVAFMVYFYDCKKRFLEKKIDAEEGQAADTIK